MIKRGGKEYYQYQFKLTSNSNEFIRIVRSLIKRLGVKEKKIVITRNFFRGREVVSLWVTDRNSLLKVYEKVHRYLRFRKKLIENMIKEMKLLNNKKRRKKK